MTTISLVGRPNVGKSSIFNLLTKSRDALVSDIPGLTRDRHYSKIYINGKFYILIDTGGIEFDKSIPLSKKMQEQTALAIDESDIVCFIVNAKEGLSAIDSEISINLRKNNKKTILIINKSEGFSHDELNAEFLPLGYQDIFFTSASHNQGINDIKDYIYSNFISLVENNDLENDYIKLSVLGKPNSGKSTLINSILGEERFISFDHPGTTRDAISADFYYKNYKLKIIDTAGIRRKGRVTDKIEKFSIIKSLLSIEKSDICILLIDTSEGLTSQDLHIFSNIIEIGKPLVLAANKWDKLNSYEKDLFKNDIDKKMQIYNNFDIHFISALKKIGINKLIESTLRAYKSSVKKISTSKLNIFLRDLQLSHQPSFFKGIRPKLKYFHQGSSAPPTFIIHGNHLEGLRKDYLKYIESSIIKTFGFVGTPIKLELKESDNPYDKSEKKPRSTGLVTRRKEINKRRFEIKKRNF